MLRAEAPLVLLRHDEGYLLSAADGVLQLAERTGDTGVWQPQQTGTYINCATGATATASTPRPADSTGGTLTIAVNGAQLEFTVQPAPARLPSEYLHDFQTQGYCVLDNIVPQESTRRELARFVKQTLGAQEKLGLGSESETAWAYTSLSPEFHRFHTHPVTLWIVEQVLETADVRTAHPPLSRLAVPGSADGGWHVDTPYQQLGARGYPTPFPTGPPLGVQCNLCVDEYHFENGGTLYVPDSWREGTPPPGRGAAEFAPAAARAVVAPAGSYFMYHAATWHRMHHNSSAADRQGLLQSFFADFSKPANVQHPDPRQQKARETLAAWLQEDVSAGMEEAFRRFSIGPHVSQLTARERRECGRLWMGDPHPQPRPPVAERPLRDWGGREIPGVLDKLASVSRL